MAKQIVRVSPLLHLPGMAQWAAVPDHPVWQHWEDLHRLFPTWWFLWTGFFSAWRARTGFDALRRLRMTRRARRAFALLDQIETPVLDDLIALAKANAERQGYFARTILFAYVSIPFSIGALVAQLAPVATQQAILAYAPAWGGALAGVGSAVVIRLVLDGQARQLLTLLEIARIERSEPA